MNLGDKIAFYRKKAGLSQEELGYKLNVTRQSVSLWETNQAQPSLANLLNLAKIFGITVDELCGENPEQYIAEPQKEEHSSENEDGLFKARTDYDPETLKKAYRTFSRKDFILLTVGVIIALTILAAYIISGVNSAFIIFPIFLLIVFAANIVRIKLTIKKRIGESIRFTPNLHIEFRFCKDNMVINSRSDKSDFVASIKYDEIKYRSQDQEFVYLKTNGLAFAIDKRSCPENVDLLFKLIGGRKAAVPQNKAIRALLLVLFILSILSFFIAFVIIAISIFSSPIPEFPYTVQEHFWKFFLFLPVTISSTVLGFIFTKKGYRCKKNIVVGIIMSVVLAAYGSFSLVLFNRTSHDHNYLVEISADTGIVFPEETYIAIEYSPMNDVESIAMVKFGEKESQDISAYMDSDENWITDSSYFSSESINSLNSLYTSGYDYFTVYNLTENTFNELEGKLIYMAYKVDKGILYISRLNSR